MQDYANSIITSQFAGLTSKGEAVDHADVDLGAPAASWDFSPATGWCSPDRQLDRLLRSAPDQYRYTGASSAIDIDLSKFVTYTDFDGDAIDLGTGHLCCMSSTTCRKLSSAPGDCHGRGRAVFTPVAIWPTVRRHWQCRRRRPRHQPDRSIRRQQRDQQHHHRPLAALVKAGADENGTFSFDTGIAGQPVKDSTGAAITSHGEAVSYGFQSGNLVGFVDSDHDGVVDSGERVIFNISLSELPFGIVIPGDPIPPGLLDGKVNDQFTFTLLDAIDHANPDGASTEDVKAIDLSGTIRFTDADGDSTGFADNSFQIKTIDDTPRETGLSCTRPSRKNSLPPIGTQPWQQDNDSDVIPIPTPIPAATAASQHRLRRPALAGQR